MPRELAFAGEAITQNLLVNSREIKKRSFVIEASSSDEIDKQDAWGGLMRFKTILVLTAIFAIVACGGGGGSSTSKNPVTGSGTGSGVTSYSASTLTSSLVTSVSPSTYTAGSEEESAFNLMNAERQACGFGLLEQNSNLDQSAKGHADWLLINNYTGHYQVSGTPGFTGVAPNDRTLAAGYANAYGGEVEFDRSPTGKSTMGAYGIRALLNAPYHAIGMISGHTQVGVSVRDSTDTATSQNRTVVNVDFGYKPSIGVQAFAPNEIKTYPCQGSTGVHYSLTNESPNPIPGRNLATNPLGSTIMILLNPNQILKITSVSMTDLNTGTPVTMRTPTDQTNDQNFILTQNEAFVSADAPLSPNTSYQVTVTGNNGATPFSRTFTFTTKS